MKENAYAPLYHQILAYEPKNEQEESDKALILHCCETMDDLLTRENGLAHFTASAWVVSPDRKRALMAYHNLYQSWAWLGGHADGENDLLAVALREAWEESGVEHVRPVSPELFSLEILTVNAHHKRGKYVSSHLHLNLTYLLEANEADALHVKPDENSGVRWLPVEEVLDAVREEHMKPIYQKLLERV